MAKKVQRKKNESADQLLTRFNRASTRFVKTSRKTRYLADRVGPLKKRRAAIIRETHRAENEKKKHYE
jgi:hypothetical protein